MLRRIDKHGGMERTMNRAKPPDPHPAAQFAVGDRVSIETGDHRNKTGEVTYTVMSDRGHYLTVRLRRRIWPRDGPRQPLPQNRKPVLNRLNPGDERIAPRHHPNQPASNAAKARGVTP